MRRNSAAAEFISIRSFGLRACDAAAKFKALNLHMTSRQIPRFAMAVA